ncbi:MAG TPA: HEAT repeat domain-containing protein [Herpetosiphonaceae bacterium]|nr:HEAT repeat domain-containing protein [Herpetosiphonaceae bacterium]
MNQTLPGSLTEAAFYQLVREKLQTVPAEHDWRATEPVSSPRRAQAFAAHDSAATWQRLATDMLAQDQPTEAAIAQAAAGWLDPQAASDTPALVPLDDEWTRVLLDAAQPFRERHWHAWAMKSGHGKSLTYIPALMRAAADANFSLRARVYRSLGQCGHPAVIQCLHEGTADPHAFARAQAIRSLGWLGDPTGVTFLLRCAAADRHAVVRRTAAAALERIVGFWLLFGEWQAIGASPERWYAALRRLVEAGLSAVVADLVWYHQQFAAADPWIMRLKQQIQADRVAQYADQRMPLSYHDFFPEAEGFEAMLAAMPIDEHDSRPGGLRFLAGWLRSDYPELQLTALASVSRRRATKLGRLVGRLLDSPHPEVVWHARRTLRCLDAGTMDQRRTNPSHVLWIAL